MTSICMSGPVGGEEKEEQEKGEKGVGGGGEWSM